MKTSHRVGELDGRPVAAAKAVPKTPPKREFCEFSKNPPNDKRDFDELSFPVLATVLNALTFL